MRGLLLTLSLPLLVAASSWATEPSIIGPPTTPEHRMVRLKLEGDFEAAVWGIHPFGVVDGTPINGGREFVFTGPPGVFTAEAMYVNWTSKGLGKATGTFEIVAASPRPPPPGPTPGPTPRPDPPPPAPVPPDPAPVPLAGKLWVSYVVDAKSVTAPQAAVRTDSAVRAAMARLDADWKTYQSDEEDLDAAHRNLLPYAEEAGYPALIVQGHDGRVLRYAKVADAAAVVEAVAKVREGR